MIDTHAHLDNEKLDCKEIVDNMKTDGLSRIITIGTCKEDLEKVVKIAELNENVYACVGVHPYFAESVDEILLDKIRQLSKNNKVVGIGEFGLDYHEGCDQSREVQKDAFEKQIKLAYELKLPMCLHIRDAHGDAIDILKKNRGFLKYSGIIHCYSGSAEFVSEYTKLGFFISFSGSITYKKTNFAIARAVPLDRILFETDCPYLSPQKLRGQINVPKNTCVTAQAVADMLEMNYKKLEEIEEVNVFNLFKKMK